MGGFLNLTRATYQTLKRTPLSKISIFPLPKNIHSSSLSLNMQNRRPYILTGLMRQPDSLRNQASRKLFLTHLTKLVARHPECIAFKEKNSGGPLVFISYAWAREEAETYAVEKLHEACVERIAEDLHCIIKGIDINDKNNIENKNSGNKGSGVLFDKWHVTKGDIIDKFIKLIIDEKADFILPMGTKLYLEKYKKRSSKTETETKPNNVQRSGDHIVRIEAAIMDYLTVYSEECSEKIIPCLLEGDSRSSLPPLQRMRIAHSFHEIDYFELVFNLVKKIYRIHNIQDEEFESTLATLNNELLTLEQLSDEKLESDYANYSEKLKTLKLMKSKDTVKEMIKTIFPNYKRIYETQFPNLPDFFVKREACFKQIDDTFLEHTTAVLTGHGGIGKTQIAIGYSQLHKENYPGGIFWIRANNLHTIRVSFREIVAKFGIDSNLSNETILENIQTILQNTEKVLMVFDGAQEYEEIKDFLPSKSTEHHVIITSQNTVWGKNYKISVKEFDHNEAIELIKNKQAYIRKKLKSTPERLSNVENPVLDEESMSKIAKVFRYYPLAISQAIAILATDNIPVKQFFQNIDQFQEQIVQKHSVDHDEYHSSVNTAWRISIESIKKIETKLSTGDKIGDVAREFIYICAYLNPDNIPFSLFEVGKSPTNRPFDVNELINTADNKLICFATEEDRRKVLQVLEERTLIYYHEHIKDSFYVTPEFQSVTRYWLDIRKKTKPHLATPQIKSLKLVAKNFDFKREDSSLASLTKSQLYLSHAIAVTKYGNKYGVLPEKTTEILCRIGSYYLHYRRDFHEAEKYFSCAKSNIETHLKNQVDNNVRQDDEPLAKRFYILNQLACISLLKKNNELAEELVNQVILPIKPTNWFFLTELATALRIRGSIALLFHQNNSSAMTRAKKDLDAALKNQIDLIHTAKFKNLRIGELNQAITLHTLGSFHFNIGNFENAKKYFFASLDLKIKLFGEIDHPEIAVTHFKIGCLYLKEKNWGEASVNLNKSYRIFSSTLGKHKHTEEAEIECRRVEKEKRKEIEKQLYSDSFKSFLDERFKKKKYSFKLSPEFYEYTNDGDRINKIMLCFFPPSSHSNDEKLNDFLELEARLKDELTTNFPEKIKLDTNPEHFEFLLTISDTILAQGLLEKLSYLFSVSQENNIPSSSLARFSPKVEANPTLSV